MRHARNYLFTLLIIFFQTTTVGFAAENDFPLNKITLELKAEQWVNTKTALVTIGVNAALADKAFEKMHGDILNKLKELSAQSDWHIVGFNRSVDKSGLEQLQTQAVARLSASDLSGLRNKVKSLSKPGETYTVDDIQYTPSDEEITETKISLRENIYQQINNEIARLNKDFPTQKYFLNDVNFLAITPIPMTNMIAYKSRTEGDASAAPALRVSDKLQLSATVVLASPVQAVK